MMGGLVPSQLPNSSRQVLAFGAVGSFPDSVRVAPGPARPGWEGCHSPAG